MLLIKLKHRIATGLFRRINPYEVCTTRLGGCFDRAVGWFNHCLGGLGEMCRRTKQTRVHCTENVGLH